MASFEVGQLVALRADPGRMGPVIEVLPAVDDLVRYRVYHAPGNSREYAEDQLIGHAETVGPVDVLSPDAFRARLTAARLRHPLTDHVYALRAARIRFVPFQFRPLLRLARADEPRLLIADDVGVGKTIEAGLILKELAARQPLDTVLVVCPKALTVKWREEMRRFDEDFKILDAGRLRYCLDEAHLEGHWPQEYARSIVHYELFRLDPYLEGDHEGRRDRVGLFELDPPPHFDLVIADEAHHVRTPGTNAHQLAEYLGQISTAMLLLSATPIQTSSRDLFTLLRVLRPDLFPERQVLEDMLATNRHLTAAARALRQGQSDAASDELDRAASTAWGQRTIAIDPRYREVRNRLAHDPATPESRVRSVHDVEEMNTLAPLVNRTRRRDIGPFTVREPHTIAVNFTPAQQELYECLIEARRDELLDRYDPVVVGLILVTLQRQAASCLPALAQRLAAEDSLTIVGVTDAPESELDELPPGRSPLPLDPRLRALARALPSEDPKFDRLLVLVRDAQAAPGPGKVLLFSYFLHTLDYLAERLSAAGVRVGLVTGRTDEEDRESLRNRFRADRSSANALDVLLSSEVGCEGLDYEFCDRLVNYDIPWNPMRVEQRIGRIDRFGQLSPKVLVFNFVTPGTVEERIFHRCWERLGLFRDALGDLEGVLGEIVQDLNELAANTELTASQLDERARQLADNAVRLAEETRGLEEAGPDLLGLDDTLTQDIDALIENGRAVSEQQLEELLRAFLAGSLPSGRLEGVPGQILRLRLSGVDRASLTSMLDARPDLAPSRPGHQLRQWLTSGNADLAVTFSAEAATADRSAAFLTPTHPLVRLAVGALAPLDGQRLSAELEVVDRDLPTGQFAFAVDTWETIAARPELRAVAFAVDLATSRAAPAVEQRLLGLLAVSTSATTPTGTAALERAREALAAHRERRRRETVAAAAQTNDLLVSRRLASLDAHHDQVAQRLADSIAAATEPRINRMRAAQRQRATEDHRRRRRELEARRGADIVSQSIAEGVLTIRHDQ